MRSPPLNERWQADLIDFKSKTQEKTDGNRLALVVIDIFSRFLWAEPLQTKEPEEVAATFEEIQRAAESCGEAEEWILSQGAVDGLGSRVQGRFFGDAGARTAT